MEKFDFLLRYIACLLGVIIGECLILGSDFSKEISSPHVYITALLIAIVLTITDDKKG